MINGVHWFTGKQRQNLNPASANQMHKKPIRESQVPLFLMDLGRNGRSKNVYTTSEQIPTLYISKSYKNQNINIFQMNKK